MAFYLCLCMYCNHNSNFHDLYNFKDFSHRVEIVNYLNSMILVHQEEKKISTIKKWHMTVCNFRKATLFKIFIEHTDYKLRKIIHKMILQNCYSFKHKFKISTSSWQNLIFDWWIDVEESEFEMPFESLILKAFSHRKLEMERCQFWMRKILIVED